MTDKTIMDKNELRPCPRCPHDAHGDFCTKEECECHYNFAKARVVPNIYHHTTRTPDTPEAEAKVFRGLCDWCHEGDMVRKCGCGKQFDHVCMDSHKCSGTPPEAEEQCSDCPHPKHADKCHYSTGETGFMLCPCSVRAADPPEPEAGAAVTRVKSNSRPIYPVECGVCGKWCSCPDDKPEPAGSGVIQMVKVCDAHNFIGGDQNCPDCRALNLPTPRPVDGGDMVQRAREFIANFPNDNYDIDEYFVIAAAAFAEQETATLSAKLATVTAELREARKTIEHYADADNWSNADAAFNGGYGGDRLDYYDGNGPKKADDYLTNHPAPQGEEGETK